MVLCARRMVLARRPRSAKCQGQLERVRRGRQRIERLSAAPGVKAVPVALVGPARAVGVGGFDVALRALLKRLRRILQPGKVRGGGLRSSAPGRAYSRPGAACQGRAGRASRFGFGPKAELHRLDAATVH